MFLSVVFILSTASFIMIAFTTRQNANDHDASHEKLDDQVKACTTEAITIKQLWNEPALVIESTPGVVAVDQTLTLVGLRADRKYVVEARLHGDHVQNGTFSYPVTWDHTAGVDIDSFALKTTDQNSFDWTGRRIVSGVTSVILTLDVTTATNDTDVNLMRMVAQPLGEL